MFWLSGEKIAHCYFLVFGDYGFDADAEDGEVGAEVAEVKGFVVGDGFVEAYGELEGSGRVNDVEDALAIRDVNAIHLLGVGLCVDADVGEKELRGGSVFEFRVCCFPWGGFTEGNRAKWRSTFINSYLRHFARYGSNVITSFYACVF